MKSSDPQLDLVSDLVGHFPAHDNVRYGQASASKDRVLKAVVAPRLAAVHPRRSFSLERELEDPESLCLNLGRVSLRPHKGWRLPDRHMRSPMTRSMPTPSRCAPSMLRARTCRALPA